MRANDISSAGTTGIRVTRQRSSARINWLSELTTRDSTPISTVQQTSKATGEENARNRLCSPPMCLHRGLPLPVVQELLSTQTCSNSSGHTAAATTTTAAAATTASTIAAATSISAATTRIATATEPAPLPQRKWEVLPEKLTARNADFQTTMNTFSDDYNTSDKCSYGRSELKTSDHRPVFAIFQLNTLKFELQRAEPLLKDAIISLGPPNSTIVCAVSGHPTSFPQLPPHVRLEGRFLHVQLGSGMDALMALSMDGVVLGEDLRLEVCLGFAGCWLDLLMADLQCLGVVREILLRKVMNCLAMGKHLFWTMFRSLIFPM
ncbi:hypothetical protein GPALN_011055 [Globodera pallida]|nr:hypothetical protein GPALN_011055 [Globodera pallida]